jgi:hypothetical protein
MDTALSPEWDRGFDQAFADLISGEPDLMRAEFDNLIGEVWTPPSSRTPPPAELPRPPGGGNSAPPPQSER